MADYIRPERYIPTHEPDKTIEKKPLKESFVREEVADLLACLEQGYELASVNAFQKEQGYVTSVNKLGSEPKIFITKQPLPFEISGDGNPKEQAAVVQLRILLEKIDNNE